MATSIGQRPLSFVSWNARGLLVRKPQLRKNKFASLGRFARRADFVLFQEALGSDALLRDALVHLRHQFHVFADIPQRGSGGVAILARKKTCPDFDALEFSGIVAGRMCRLSVRFDPSRVVAGSLARASVNELVLYNIHNFVSLLRTSVSFAIIT